MTAEEEDAEALAMLAGTNAWLRALLCTLARRGTQLRQASPDRADALLIALGPWPWFKGGQFLFDLMEFEDFMVDGPPPPLLPSALDAVAWERVTGRLRAFKAALDGAVDAVGSMPGDLFEGLTTVSPADNLDLPPLEPGLHLYRDVALGIIASAGPVLRARRTAEG